MSMRKIDLPRSTLKEWLFEFYEIYGEKNTKRSPSELWLGVVRHVSKVAEELRKIDLGRTLEEIGYTFCWYLNFVNWCNNPNPKSNLHVTKTLDEIIWYKYPGCCPVCTEARCICIARKQYIESLPSSARKKIQKKNMGILEIKREAKPPTTLIAWKEMFGFIYGESLVSLNINEICFHLLEEIGEVAQEIFLIENLKEKNKALQRIPHLESEIADVFSWLMALVNMIHFHFHMMHNFDIKYLGSRLMKKYEKPVEVPEIIYQAYHKKGRRKLSCQHCWKRPCNCDDDCLMKII